MTGHSALIARLEAAEAGGRELDYEIRDALNDPHWNIRVPADWTTSLDAALALAERVLPGWQITLSTKGGEMPPWVQIYPLPLEEDNYLDPEFAATPALALCIAILKAKAQGEGG